MSLSISKDVLVWFVRAIEEFASSQGNRAPYRTNRDGKRVFLIQQRQNQFGRFIKLIELGTSKSNGIIALPEGLNGSGWNDFVKKVRVFTNSTHSGFSSKNRVSRREFEAAKVSDRKKIGHSSCRDTSATSYISALKAPTQAN